MCIIMRHNMICIIVDAGVARPMWNSVAPGRRLTKNATGILTQKAPTRPCIITNSVLPYPLKYPMKQNRNGVRRQSMAYDLR